jgi:hypothetical protein
MWLIFFAKQGYKLVVRRIGIRRFESFRKFCGRARKFESQSQGFESLLPSKKPKIAQNRQQLGNFFHVFALAITNQKYMPFITCLFEF